MNDELANPEPPSKTLAEMDIGEVGLRLELCKQVMREAIVIDDDRWWNLLPQVENLQDVFDSMIPEHVEEKLRQQEERKKPKPEPVRVQMGTARAGARARG